MSLDASGKKKADDRGHGRRPLPVPPMERLDAGARSGRVVGADGVDEARRVFLHTVHRGIVRSRRSIGNSAMLIQDDAGRIRTNARTGNNELSRIEGRSGVAAWSPRALILSCENVLMLNLPWIDPSYATTLVSVNGSTNVTSPRSAVNG
jgi:hypothetical protein